MGEQVTPWFPVHVRPVRVGYYQILEWQPRFGTAVATDVSDKAYWDGRRWFYHEDNDLAVAEWVALSWRGLASDPAGK